MNRTRVSARFFIELDSGKICFTDMRLKVVVREDKTYCLKVSHVAEDYTKKFYLTLNKDLVRNLQGLHSESVDKLQYGVGLSYIYNRILNEFIPKPTEAVYTILQYKQGSPRVDSTLCTLLNHFAERKVRIKKLNGRTFVNLKMLTEGQIILHSLFKLVREHYMGLADLASKLVVTGNNIVLESSINSGFYGRRNRHREPVSNNQIPIAYNLIQDEKQPQNQGTLVSLQSIRTRRIGYEKSLYSYNLSETAYNPSAVLSSHLYRLDHNQIVEMGELLLSSSAMLDINFIIATYICRVKASYFMVNLSVTHPDSLDLWRDKTARPKDMSMPGTWVDKIGLKVQVYNCDLFKVTSASHDLTFRELVSNFHVSELESIYRGMVCGGMSLNIHQEIRNLAIKNLVVQENSLIWNQKSKKTVKTIPSSEGFSTSRQELPILLSRPYAEIDPYRHSSENRGSRYDRPQTYALSKKPILEHVESLEVEQTSELMPWGTRYKRLQLMTDDNRVFYTLINMGTYRMRLRFVYFGDHNTEIITISACNIETSETYKLAVTDNNLVERIVHIMMQQKAVEPYCHQFVKVSMNLYLDITKALPGKNFLVNDLYQERISVIRQETVEQTKWNITCKTETVYLRNFFLNRTLFFPTKHVLLGKLYVECNIYFSFKLSKNQAIVLLVVSPMRKRTTTYHVVVNAVDLETYFDCDIFPIVHNEQELIKVLSKVVNKLVLVKRKSFSILAVPLQWVARRISSKYTEVLRNVFDQRELLKPEKDQERSYLKKTIYHSEVIVKVVVKFKKQYWILTVVKNLLLNRIDIEGYIPAVKRKFQCRMTSHDYEFLTGNATTELRNKAPKFVQKLSELASSFQHFETLLREEVDQDKIDMGLVSPIYISRTAIQTMKTKEKSALGSLSPFDAVKQLFQKNFQATKFWIDVLKNSKLILKHNDLLIEIETFRAVLKEHIWESLCLTGNLKYEITVDLDTEHHFTAGKKTVEVFNPIPMDKLDQYSFLLKVIFLREDQQHHVDKVNLHQLYKIYGRLLQEKVIKSRQLVEGKTTREASTVVKTQPEGSISKKFTEGSDLESVNEVEPSVASVFSRLRMSDIRDLTRILEVNVLDSINERYMSVIDSKLTYFNEEKVLSKQIIYQDKYERRMKLNSKLCLDIMIDPHYKEYNDVLVSRHVFTVRPQQILVILYNKRRKQVITLVAQFSFTIYNSNSCKVSQTDMSVRDIQVHVPHLLVLIEHKEFTEVGKRLLSVYKNSLLSNEYIQRRLTRD